MKGAGRWLSFLLVLLLGLSSPVCGDEVASSTPDVDSIVPSLTAANFDDFLTKNPVTLVKFMALWCGHCKKMKEEYEQAAVILKKEGVKVSLAEVNAPEHPTLAQKYGVQGYPTLFFFQNGKQLSYEGGRTKDEILNWVRRMTRPAVQWADDLAAAETQAKKSVSESKGINAVYLAVVPAKNHESATIYDAIAQEHRMKGEFIAVADSDNKKPTISVYHKNEDKVESTISTKEKLDAYVVAESAPLLGPVSGENYGSYMKRSSNWTWLVCSPEDYEKLGGAVRKVSKNYRNDFNFVWLDTEALKYHAEQALGVKEYPAAVLIWEGSKYKLETEISEKSLTKFIEAVKAGKVKKFNKSEPVPESNEGPLKTLVGSEFSKLVLQADRDTLLMVHAPWCGHCKKFMPILEQFAELVKESPKLDVFKFDGTNNEPDANGFDFHGFPTIFFVKAGAMTPTVYDGDRTVEGLVTYVKKNAAHTVKSAPIPASTEDENKDEL